MWRWIRFSYLWISSSSSSSSSESKDASSSSTSGSSSSASSSTASSSESKASTDTSKENGVVVEQSVNAGKEIDEESTITITVNKFEETKEAKLRINVKSLTGGYSESTNSTDVVKTKKLTVKVGEDKVWEENVDLNTTNKEITVSGKGTITVRVYLNDVLQKRQFDINLNTTSNYTFE